MPLRTSLLPIPPLPYPLALTNTPQHLRAPRAQHSLLLHPHSLRHRNAHPRALLRLQMAIPCHHNLHLPDPHPPLRAGLRRVDVRLTHADPGRGRGAPTDLRGGGRHGGVTEMAGQEWEGDVLLADGEFELDYL